MKKPIISKDFTLEDIRKIREYNYEMTKNMTKKEKALYEKEKEDRAREIFYRDYAKKLK